MFLTLLFLASSQTKVTTLFFYLSIWNTTNRNTYRHKSFQFKLKAYIIIANRTINRMNIPYPSESDLQSAYTPRPLPTSIRSLLLTAPKILRSKFKSFSILDKKEATILLSRCRQPTLKTFH